LRGCERRRVEAFSRARNERVEAEVTKPRPSTGAQELELMDRIAAAMAGDAVLADVRVTLADVTLARDAAAAAAERAREVALDPATRDVSAAREALSDAVFEYDRLAAAA